MAEAAITFLLENVKNQLVEYANLSSGAEKERKHLQSELEMMNAFLIEYGNKGEKREVFRQIERQIREAVDEAEDTLDACLTQKAKAPSLLSPNINIDLAKKVKDLRLELQPIFKRAMKGLKALPIADGSATRPATSDNYKLQKTHVLREDNVVGFADEEATLMKYLDQKTEDLDVISIVGMPGLGKTTLARKIYRHQKIQFEFPTVIWVNVSQELNAREVFLTILKKFTGENMWSKEDWVLPGLVRQHLERERFIIFLDDVWTVADWRRIEVALPKNNKLGKVVITSRHVRVGSCNRQPHKLRFLSLDESWELFQLEVFGKNNSCPPELEGLGKGIAEQCGGVPLAVVVIAGILVENCGERRDLWEKVFDSLRAYLQVDKMRRTEYIISLSYDKLRHDLRDCFLYLGMFPQDTDIPAWNLIRLWIAEGFIQENRGRDLEEVAEDNLNDLVARNLVMVEKTKANGDIKTCRVHNMIRNFCQKEAACANKNLFQEVTKTRDGVFEPEIVNHRRLCIHSNVMEFLHKKPKGPGVRSFVCFSKETILLPTEYSGLISDAFDLLRVLDSTPLRFTKFPRKLPNLIHLRYITLSATECRSLPQAVSKLKNLQTIKIDTMSREIKVDISKMTKLRHLKTKAAICLNEKGGGGENLQTLSRLLIECCSDELFDRTPNLKNLGIRGDITELVYANYLEILERLEKLKLVHDLFPHAAKKPLHRLPHTHRFPPKLRMLTLSSTYLDWTEMTTLGSLQNLEELKLEEMAFRGTLWEAQGGGFPLLETLHIARTDLEIWTAASADPFPKLKNLILKNCERLQEIPSIVRKGKSLQFVEIERVTQALVDSAKKIEEEKQQMQDGDVRAESRCKLKISPEDRSSSQGMAMRLNKKIDLKKKKD